MYVRAFATRRSVPGERTTDDLQIDAQVQKDQANYEDLIPHAVMQGKRLKMAVPRIYTTKGDDGTTGLIGGKRVSKDDLRVQAYGAVDEVNAVLGVVRSCPLSQPVDSVLERIQDDLFTLGANLAIPEGIDATAFKIPPISDADLRRLETTIDEFDARLPALKEFILPGGNMPAAMLHLARTIARRAERACVTLSRSEAVAPEILRYLNRLSDLCFVMARTVGREARSVETHPRFDTR